MLLDKGMYLLATQCTTRWTRLPIVVRLVWNRCCLHMVRRSMSMMLLWLGTLPMVSLLAMLRLHR